MLLNFRIRKGSFVYFYLVNGSYDAIACQRSSPSYVKFIVQERLVEHRRTLWIGVSNVCVRICLHSVDIDEDFVALEILHDGDVLRILRRSFIRTPDGSSPCHVRAHIGDEERFRGIAARRRIMVGYVKRSGMGIRVFRRFHEHRITSGHGRTGLDERFQRNGRTSAVGERNRRIHEAASAKIVSFRKKS